MPRILLVDDAYAIRSTLCNLLKNHGFEVVEAENGEQGLEAVSSDTIDMVITDLNMPVMDGLTMCEHFKRQGHQLPVFILTTQSSPELKARAKDCGVLAWIVKPHKDEILLSGIRKVLKLA